MKTDYLELYTDYLISGNSYATATGLSAMMNNDVSHDQIRLNEKFGLLNNHFFL